MHPAHLNTPLRLACRLSSIIFFLCTQNTLANNGTIGYAYPMKAITIDGDLSDWPADLTKYPLTNFSDQPDAVQDKDLRAYLMMGYNLAEQCLYVAVEVWDDDIVRNPENPLWYTHDMQVLYLDPAHKPGGTGVIGYEINLDTAKIVEQPNMLWYEQVKNATWDNVKVKIIHRENKIIYEWRILLKEHIVPGRTIGFDYSVFDKDTDQRWSAASWGNNSMKHASYKNIGDVVLMPPAEKTVKVSGTLKWEGEQGYAFPQTIQFSSATNPQLRLHVAVDSTGQYTAQLPLARYNVSIPEPLIWHEREAFKAKLREPFTLETYANNPTAIPLLTITKEVVNDFIPKKGLLHDFDATKANEVDEFIQHYQTFYNIPGVSLALIKDGQLAFHKTYGVQNAMTGDPIKEQSLFEAASVTKPVFAYVVNRLVERGAFDLDKPLHEYLPFEDLQEYEEYKLMTGRHVLMHVSGLPNWGREMKFTPGTKYGYSGEGFEYLKRAVAHTMGKDIQQILDEELIEPLGLYHMYFADSPELRAVGVSGHRSGVPTIQYWPEAPGMAWSMFTEAKAFSRFAIALLEERGLAPATYNSMFTLLTEFPLEEGEAKPEYPEGMGLGIAIRESPYGQVFGHGGNNGDFQCNFEVYKDLKMGYIVFTNSDVGYLLNKDLAQFLVEGKKIAQAD